MRWRKTVPREYIEVEIRSGSYTQKRRIQVTDWDRELELSDSQIAMNTVATLRCCDQGPTPGEYVIWQPTSFRVIKGRGE